MPDSFDANDVLSVARRKAPITDRVNVEPPILHGMNATEAKVIAAGSFVVFLLIGGVVFLATGFWQVLLMLVLMGPLASLWFGSSYLERLKRGRPDGFYSQAMHLWLVERGLARSQFILHRGWWSLGRTLGFALESPLEPPPEHFPPKP